MNKVKTMFFSLVCAATVMGFLGLVLVMMRMSPLATSSTAWLSWTLFFFSSFVFCTGIATLVGGSVRLMRWREAMYFYQYIISLRQGILLSLFLQSFLALNVFRLVTWWNLLLIFIFIFLIELFFLNRSELD